MLFRRGVARSIIPGDVEDEADVAVAEDRAAGDALDVADAVAEGLDDHLLLSEQLIHQNAALPLIVADDDDQPPQSALRCVA